MFFDNFKLSFAHQPQYPQAYSISLARVLSYEKHNLQFLLDLQYNIHHLHPFCSNQLWIQVHFIIFIAFILRGNLLLLDIAESHAYLIIDDLLKIHDECGPNHECRFRLAVGSWFFHPSFGNCFFCISSNILNLWFFQIKLKLYKDKSSQKIWIWLLQYSDFPRSSLH